MLAISKLPLCNECRSISPTTSYASCGTPPQPCIKVAGRGAHHLQTIRTRSKPEQMVGSRARSTWMQNRREVFQRAKAVVVCANGSEAPRLLLASRSSRFSQGLANSSGLVGKYLMADGGFEAYGVFEHALNEFKSVQTTRVIHDFYDPDPKRGFYGGGGIDARFDFYPISFALSGLPKNAPRWGRAWTNMVVQYFARTMTLLAQATCPPQERNSMTLDPDTKDAWGLGDARDV